VSVIILIGYSDIDKHMVSVVWGVAPALHSPLMSVTNAISGLVRVTADKMTLILISLYNRLESLECSLWVVVTFPELFLKRWAL